MTKTKRRLLFYNLLLVFAVAGAGIVFYSQGWRLNAENCGAFEKCRVKFQKVGAVYIETLPKDVIIKINGKIYEDESGLLRKGTLIENFLPGNYDLEIGKKAYLPWRKTLSVESGLVSEAIEIVLTPEEIKKETVPMGRLRGNEFVDKSIENKFILKDSKNGVYYLYNNGGSLKEALNVNAAFKNAGGGMIKKMAFHPFEPNALIIETKNGLESFDVFRLQRKTIVKPPFSNWKIKNSGLYFVRKNELIFFSLIAKTETILTEFSSPAAEFDIIGNAIVFLNDSDVLYLLDETKKAKPIARDVKFFSLSTDEKKIAFLSKNGALNVYFLKDWEENNRKKAGESVILNAKNGSAIEKIYWRGNSYHLFLVYPGGNGTKSVDFAEIDERLPLNQTAILQKVKNIYHDSSSGKFYFFEQNAVFSFAL